MTAWTDQYVALMLSFFQYCCILLVLLLIINMLHYMLDVLVLISNYKTMVSTGGYWVIGHYLPYASLSLFSCQGMPNKICGILVYNSLRTTCTEHGTRNCEIFPMSKKMFAHFPEKWKVKKNSTKFSETKHIFFILQACSKKYSSFAADL